MTHHRTIPPLHHRTHRTHRTHHTNRTPQALDDGALEFIDTVSELPTRTEHFSGAELAGLVRSAASFALGRAALETCDLAAGESCAGAVVMREVRLQPDGQPDGGVCRGLGRSGCSGCIHGWGAAVAAVVPGSVWLSWWPPPPSPATITPPPTHLALPPPSSDVAQDFERALAEVTPALGKNDDELRRRFAPHGVASTAHSPLRDRLLRFCHAPRVAAPGVAAPAGRLGSLLMAPEGPGAGASALAAWAACQERPDPPRPLALVC